MADILSVNGGRDYKHLKIGPIPVYGTGGYMLSVNQALSEKDGIGIGRKGTIDSPFILRAPYWTVDTLFYAIPNSSSSLGFLYAIFQRIPWKKLDESTGVPSLSKQIINSVEVKIPQTEEQTKIGSFFKSLDDLITVNQRKLNTLKKLKKSYLQKMFPQNGSEFPELRFAGFTTPWEKRKLGEFLLESREAGTNGLTAKKLTVKLWGKGVVAKSTTYDGSIATKYYIRHAGQLMYGKLDFVHAAFGIVPKNLDGYESTLDSPAFDIHDLNPTFLLKKIQQKNFYLYQGMIANGSRKAKRIHVDTFLNMTILAPSLREQTKIGNFFKSLEKTISVNQRKLDALKKLKQGYLQKMFC
ncbi:restriction endonuclease subunit S [Oenococcus sp.]|uniref:restriction endonuclease subunit S n=1 Tax=Oenococcus sp. TaxID=1979414 RepID=UPI0039E93F32